MVASSQDIAAWTAYDLAKDVYVYSEDGPDLERFVDLVTAFNERSVNPTE